MGTGSSKPASASRATDWGNENVVPNCRKLDESASAAVWEARRCSDGRHSIRAHPLFGGEDFNCSPCPGWHSNGGSPGQNHSDDGGSSGRHAHGVQRRLDMDAGAARRHMAASSPHPAADRRDAALRDVASEGAHNDMPRDGTALAAAAAGSDGFFSPLSGGVLAPLQQRRLATPDLSPHARRRQLDPEQQTSPWQPLAPLGREHSRSPVRVPCSERRISSNGERDSSPLRPPLGDSRQRVRPHPQDGDPDMRLTRGGGGGCSNGQRPRQSPQQLTPPPASPEQPRNRSGAATHLQHQQAIPHQQPGRQQVPTEDDSLWRQQQRQQPQRPSPLRPSHSPDRRRHYQQQQRPGDQAPALQHARTQWQRQQQQQQQQQADRPAAPQQQPSRHHGRRRQQQQPPPLSDLARTSTDTVVLAARAAALGIHPLPTPPGSPLASPPDSAPSSADSDAGGGTSRVCSSSLADPDAPLCQQARRQQPPQRQEQQAAVAGRRQPGWLGRRGGGGLPAAESADAPPPTRPRSDPDPHCRAPPATPKEGYEPHYGAARAATLAPATAGGHASGSSNSTKGSGGGSAPAHFLCPITHQLMFDPVLAADGFCYEASAISKWLEAHDTSPLTNARLPHRGLVRNHALRSAIMEAQRRGG